MFYVNVYGFHTKIKKSKIYHLLDAVVFGKKRQFHFCLHDIHPDVDPTLNVVTLTFGKKKNAVKAINLINGFVYYDVHSKCDLHLSAIDVTEHHKVDADSDDQIINNKVVKHTRQSQGLRESRDRSRSPHIATDITNIDMEIELIQKERILIVEQRKLLLEKKRLELLKDFEPTSINDLERYAAAVERQDDEESQNVPQKPAKARGTSLPVLASKAIIKQMKDAIPKRGNIRGIVTRSLYFTLRKRIIEIIKGKSNLETDDVIKMYRDVYPIDTDKVLLDHLEAKMYKAETVKKESNKGDFQVGMANETGPSDTVKCEVNNKKEESMEGPENIEVTTEILDNELDDWLEDDKVNQDCNNVKEADTKQSVLINDKQL